MQLQPKERQSQSALNNKIGNIDLYLAGVERDLSVLAEEENLWREERLEWEQAVLGQIERAGGKLRAELADIEREIRRRDERVSEAVEKIHARIKAIQEVQSRCGALVAQLNNRIGAVEEVLGGK